MPRLQFNLAPTLLIFCAVKYFQRGHAWVSKLFVRRPLLTSIVQRSQRLSVEWKTSCTISYLVIPFCNWTREVRHVISSRGRIMLRCLNTVPDSNSFSVSASGRTQPDILLWQKYKFEAPQKRWAKIGKKCTTRTRSDAVKVSSDDIPLLDLGKDASFFYSYVNAGLGFFRFRKLRSY